MRDKNETLNTSYERARSFLVLTSIAIQYENNEANFCLVHCSVCLLVVSSKRIS